MNPEKNTVFPFLKVINKQKLIINSSLFLLLILFPLATFFFWNENLDSDLKISHDKFGTFGDFFGGVIGAIWSLAGVILFYTALKEQRKDFKNNKKALLKQIKALKIQGNEFKLQRQELKRSREIFIEQAKTLKQQRLESTYFSMLSILRELIKDLNSISSKKDFFLDCNDQIHQEFYKTIGEKQKHLLQETSILCYAMEKFTKIIEMAYQNISKYYIELFE